MRIPKEVSIATWPDRLWQFPIRRVGDLKFSPAMIAPDFILSNVLGSGLLVGLD